MSILKRMNDSVIQQGSEGLNIVKDRITREREKTMERLQQAEADRTHKAAPNPSTRIWQLMFSHLIGAPAGGGIIGWGLDTLFGTFPVLFLLMLFLGFGVGVVNVMRISKTS